MLIVEPIQGVENLAKVQVFDPSYEADYVAVLPAAIAVERACRWIDRERWNAVLVEWAEADKVAAGGPELNILSNDLRDWT